VQKSRVSHAEVLTYTHTSTNQNNALLLDSLSLLEGPTCRPSISGVSSNPSLSFLKINTLKSIRLFATLFFAKGVANQTALTLASLLGKKVSPNYPIKPRRANAFASFLEKKKPPLTFS
jgi:hypothetical protein